MLSHLASCSSVTFFWALKKLKVSGGDCSDIFSVSLRLLFRGCYLLVDLGLEQMVEEVLTEWTEGQLAGFQKTALAHFFQPPQIWISSSPIIAKILKSQSLKTVSWQKAIEVNLVLKMLIDYFFRCTFPALISADHAKALKRWKRSTIYCFEFCNPKCMQLRYDALHGSRCTLLYFDENVDALPVKSIQ